MSWDIYGNVLRRGYCEVHPQVNEEYPCSLCYAEDKGRTRHQEQQQTEQQQYPYYRIAANIVEDGGDVHTVIISYEYNEIDGDGHKDILSLSVYGAYPALLGKIDNLADQVRAAIENIEGAGHVCFLASKPTIL